ncbi:hypothetical protein [Streptomyces lunaelactis]|uniref:hypothetical protein n=1 Tax=Streptomyces lunaelactis TaxID=1535768 RepID=UPI001584914D|nr:hypothetical protein [Streptomyces lunaelactis]NUL14482.1 hypothetical protein [Streptomyces lunaelactis]
MTAVQPPLFLPGWEVEPCDTAPPPALVRRRTRRNRRMPDAWVCGRPAYDVAVSIDDWPGGEP